MRKAFTLMELIFVIVIFGILAGFGTELLTRIYENYIYSNTFNRLQNRSESAVKQIANRLQYRIKDSTIARVASVGTAVGIGNTVGGEDVIEWIGVDIDGWRGTASTAPNWSGFIDLEASTATSLNSPGTLTDADTNMSIFFIGSNVDLNNNNFGWNGTAPTGQTGDIHPIKAITTAGVIEPKTGDDFTGVDVYEFYQLAKTAYAVRLDGTDLRFYYGYQPWNGGTYGAASNSLIMEDVSSFKFTSIGDILVIQVCVSDGNLTGLDFSICKEKVVF